MRIGISMRVVHAATYAERRDAISQDWLQWLAALGHLALPIPNAPDQAAAYLDALDLDALVLTGGNDIVPRPGAADDTAAERTQTERALIAATIARAIPVFGTCRGLHVINLHFGGTVIDSLDAGPGGNHGHVGRTHPVVLEPVFADLAGARRIETNSFHNQAVSDDGLAPGLRAFAHTTDGLVEGVYHPTLPIVAVQWHPERPNPAADFDAAILARLLTDGAFWPESPQ